MFRFLFSFGIPGVITFFLTHKVFEDKFGIMGAVWCFSCLFLAIDSGTKIKEIWEPMEVAEALAKLKFLVSHDRFKLVARRDTMKVPVSRVLAKTIIEQLSLEDFVKHERNRNNYTQFIWVFKTEYDQTYYIKFVFAENGHLVVFISFHLDSN